MQAAPGSRPEEEKAERVGDATRDDVTGMPSHPASPNLRLYTARGSPGGRDVDTSLPSSPACPNPLLYPGLSEAVDVGLDAPDRALLGGPSPNLPVQFTILGCLGRPGQVLTPR